MPLAIPRLRRWLVAAALALSLVVAGVYLHRRRQVHEVLKHLPGKMNVEIQQSAEGFKVSKSEQGRTLFTIQASKAVQFKLGGRAELHHVTITLYGRDSSRYDQIYGDDFAYDPDSGNVTAKGEVRIDLEANPEGLLKPDQSKPTEMKNPIHLVTKDLIFNQKSGDAFTPAKVELRMRQASGSAQGMHYAAMDNVLTLDSRVDLTLNGSRVATLKAERGVITKTPREVVLVRPVLLHGASQMSSERAVLSLREDNTVERVQASQGIEAHLTGDSPIEARAEQADFAVNAKQDGLSRAVFTGNVHMESSGARPSRVNAGRVQVEFAARSQVRTVHAQDNVKLVELAASESRADNSYHSAGGAAGVPARRDGRDSRPSTDDQQVEISSPAIDFFVANGKHLERAETLGVGGVTVLPEIADGSSTTVTAGKFLARFDEQSRLRSVHGAPDAKIVNVAPGQPNRVSTSARVDAAFRAAGGIDSIVQQGDVQYNDGERQARADQARYTPADQVLELTGSPRVTDKGLATTARSVRLYRATGDAIAAGNVKSTYSEGREQPTGALLSAASPIHVTSRTMTAHQDSATAVYEGDVRLWQDANMVQAPRIEFDRDRRSVQAVGDGQPVSTALVQIDKNGNVTPITITSRRLTYTDDQHRAEFQGGATARGADVTVTADHLDAFLVPRSAASAASAGNHAKGQGQLDHMVAQGHVEVREAGREATGERLAYTAADDKIVLTGGSPSIFDAEQGKIRGDSLTFFRRDDRVLVEGRDSSPTVTQTRVAR
jgi:lipopolysaccharide export system protein LptA